MIKIDPVLQKGQGVIKGYALVSVGKNEIDCRCIGQKGTLFDAYAVIEVVDGPAPKEDHRIVLGLNTGPSAGVSVVDSGRLLHMQPRKNERCQFV